ncbi:MAG: flagellar assembly protein FliX [Beijerinckiaceae bacterium]
MRVSDRAPIAHSPGSSATQRTAGPSTRFSLGGGGATGSASSTQAAAPTGVLEGLIALQASGDALERQKRALKRGYSLLDSLDELKLALLSGRIATSSLQSLAAQLKQRRDLTDDPRLADILAHIELRAEVELAKLAKQPL